jgi:hypothetical protein
MKIGEAAITEFAQILVRTVQFFVQLGFNLSYGVTDTLESSSILIYFETRKSIYSQKNG